MDQISGIERRVPSVLFVFLRAYDYTRKGRGWSPDTAYRLQLLQQEQDTTVHLVGFRTVMLRVY